MSISDLQAMQRTNGRWDFDFSNHETIVSALDEVGNVYKVARVNEPGILRLTVCLTTATNLGRIYPGCTTTAKARVDSQPLQFLQQLGGSPHLTQ